MQVQGAFNMLLRPGLRKDFRDNLKKYESIYPKYLRTSKTTDPEQRATIMTGLSRLIERGDGEGITYAQPVLGPQVVGVDKEFAAGYIVSRRAVEDDLYGKANQGSKWLAHAANMTMEYRAAAFLDDAFTGTTFKGIDNKSLLNTAHTLINSSSTCANKPTTDVALSLTGITSLLDLAQNLKDENGDPIVTQLKKLIIGNSASEYHKALQIFGSDKEPFTADNQDNAIKKRMATPEIIMNPYRTSTKSYFMTDPELNDAHFVTRRAVEMDDTFDFETDAAKFKASCRFLVWFVDWRGWFGANPS
jgi:hypothetical protein